MRAQAYVVPVAGLSKAQVCGSSIAGIVVSKTAEGKDARPFCMLCCARSGLCGRARHSFRCVLQGV